MNAERLLAHYERIADAPDAVPRLRRFILDLAVRGKLVEQDPNDEPAAISLVERKRHRSQREVRPLDVPGWLVAPVASLLQFQYGKGMKASERLDEGPVPVFGSNGLVGYCETPLTEAPAIIVGRKGSAGALNLCDGPSWTTDVAYFVEAPNYFDLRYLLIGLQTLNLGSLGKGVKPGLSRADVYDLPLSVPPLAEQYRIVAKVDELMALCYRLEAARTERETTRDRMAAAILIRLNDPDPDPVVFRNHAAFALENLAPLTTRTDQIKALRQTILSLAVRGKLVEQDPNDEPASELLKRIAAEKARLVKARKIKKTSLESPIFPNNTPFSLPTGWAWITLGWICSKTGSGSTPRGGKKAYKPSGVVFLRSQNVHDYGLRLSDAVYIDRATHERMSGTAIETSDLLLNITGGSIGRCCLVPDGLGEANISQHVAIIRTAINGPQHFMRCVVLSPYFQDFISNEQTGAGRGGLPKNKMDRIPVPLPPLAEQHRIVARVDELMVLCNRLESSLAAADTTRHHFLESLLQDVLEPAADQFATVRRI